MMLEKGGISLDVDGTIFGGQLRPGLKDFMVGQIGAGRRIILTTSGGGKHFQDVMEVMKAAGLQQLITATFEREQIDMGRGKSYIQAAAALGLTPQEAPHKMVIADDTLDGQPVDLDRVVFILDPKGSEHSAGDLGIIIQSLLDAGNNSFINGFNELTRTHNKPFMIGNSTVELTLRDPTEGGKIKGRFSPGIRIPTVKVLNSKATRR